MTSVERQILLLRRMRKPLGIIVLLNSLVMIAAVWNAARSTESRRVDSRDPQQVAMSEPQPSRVRAPGDSPENDSEIPKDGEPISVSPVEEAPLEQPALAESGDHHFLSSPPQDLPDDHEAQAVGAQLQAKVVLEARRKAEAFRNALVQAAPWEWPQHGAARLADRMSDLAASLQRAEAELVSSDGELTSADPQLVLRNPSETRGVIHYLVDDAVFSLGPGMSHSLIGAQPRRVRFHRGDDFGEAQLVVSSGEFVFRVTDGGWQLDDVAASDP